MQEESHRKEGEYHEKTSISIVDNTVNHGSRKS